MLNNSSTSNFFSSENFDDVALLQSKENLSANNKDKIRDSFQNFICYLNLDQIGWYVAKTTEDSYLFRIKHHFDFDIVSYNYNLQILGPTISSNSNGIRISFNPAGIDIQFIVKNQTYGKECLIKNCKNLLVSRVKEDPVNCDYREHFFFKANKRSLRHPPKFSDLLTDIACINHEDIEIFCRIEKTKILGFSNNRLLAKVNRILFAFLHLLILASLDNPIDCIKLYEYYRDYHFFYSLINCSEETGIDETELERWVNNINRKGQIILQGPPGTGKTFIAKQLAEHFTRGRDGFSEIIQFHPSYSYEDFIEGIRPRTANGQLTYDLVPGRFLEFCKKAESYDDICVLIIDEINRANLSNVFGELMYLLEYRDQEINLAGSHEPFKIPGNVRIIGTMNTADRSIALVDHALRRRFAFIKIAPNYNILKRYHEDDQINFSIYQLIQVLQDINKMIDDPNYEIGISFFMIWNIEDNIQDIWEMEIEPYLEEYFYNALDKIEQFRWNQVKVKLDFDLLNEDEDAYDDF
jgi:DNA polymerase III delta prime subunit